MQKETPENITKEIKKISLAIFQTIKKISKLEISEIEKKVIINDLKSQDKKLLKLNNIKFSDNEKENLLLFLE